MSHQYNLQFEKLCSILDLGKLQNPPEEISGGLLHRMFAIDTTSGKYAVKALNPQIMARPTALNNFIRSERIANIVATNVPALPAKTIGGEFIHNLDGQYYLIFDWIDGYSLNSKDINNVHCEFMGAILANIHNTDFSQMDIADDPFTTIDEIDWNFYLCEGQRSNSAWVNQLQHSIEKLYTWSVSAKRSYTTLATDTVISHGDLEPKNVMWSQDNPTIIDWESAGHIHPMHDLIETAFYWSEGELGGINRERFISFIRGYQSKVGTLQADWRMILEHGYLGKLGWLEYSLKRSLWIECTDEKEQQMGTLHVTATLNTLKDYEDVSPLVEYWLNNINKNL